MGALLFKPGVTLKPDPAGARLLGAIDRVARGWDNDLTITAGSDSHPPADVHSLGRAFDIRTHGLTDADKQRLVRATLLDLQESTFDAPAELAIDGIWFALATHRWFGQIEAHGKDGEHCHLQLRRGAVFPPAQNPTTEKTLNA